MQSDWGLGYKNNRVVLSEVQTDENHLTRKRGHRCCLRTASVCERNRPAEWTPTVSKTCDLSLKGSYLPERRPLLLLLQVGVVRVVGVVAGVTVGVEDVSCAEFVQRSEGNTWRIPETHCAVFVPVNVRFKWKHEASHDCMDLCVWMRTSSRWEFTIHVK